MRRLLFCGLMSALVAAPGFAADDVVSAVAGSVKAVDKATETTVVKTADGTEHTFHFVGRTVVHGAKATGAGTKDALEKVKDGDEVVVHYTAKGTTKTAEEVDHVGKDGMKKSVGAIKGVDHDAKTVTVRGADGTEDTYHMTANAFRETGKGLDKGGKVTVYYTEESGKKIAHFFAAN